MTNAFQLFRSLVIYGVCLPLAIFIGYLLATPTDVATFATVGLFLALMTFPLFLKWHYPWLIFSWNTVAGLYFLPGRPSWVLIMTFVSFSLSLLAYILNRNLKFISVPSMTRPILFMLAVVCVTAKFTGGIGFGALGADGMGGKRYLYIFSAIAGYFALTARRIPPEKAKLYINLFFMGAVTCVIGSLFSLAAPWMYPVFLIFPAESVDTSGSSNPDSIVRLGGLATASMSIIAYLLAKYGVQGLLDLRKHWRIPVFLLLVLGTLFGGYRLRVIELMFTIGFMFCLEGLFRSRMLPAFILIGVLALSLLVPFADKLPLTIQRSLTFLPLKLDPTAELNAKGSTDWRVDMWKTVLPQVPHYLILGKGYGIDAHDMEVWLSGAGGSSDNSGSAMAGDYHNGPLSLVMPFGIGGVIGFIWILVAGYRVLLRNYQFGDPELKMVNRYFLTFFAVKIILFFFVFGSLYSDLIVFLGTVGMSIALNGGVKSPATAPVTRPVFHKFKLAPAAR